MRPSAPRRIPLPSYPAGCLAKLAGCLAKLLRARQQAEAGSWRPVHDYMELPGSPELEEAYKLYVSEPDVSNGRRTLGSGAVTARERTAPGRPGTAPHHVGVVCWSDNATSGGGALGELEKAAAEMARQAGLEGRPIFLPQDESSAWAWLPLGSEGAFPVRAVSVCGLGAGSGIRFALGVPGSGVSGFRRTHEQALGAHTVALAAAGSRQPMTSFADVAPLALMSGSTQLVRAWVIETLGSLADDDGHHATLRDTLRVFLQENGSFVAAAERLTLHKNTVRYRIGKAEESLGRPVGEDRLHIELALLAAQWLGSTVLRQVGPARL